MVYIDSFEETFNYYNRNKELFKINMYKDILVNMDYINTMLVDRQPRDFNGNISTLKLKLSTETWLRYTCSMRLQAIGECANVLSTYYKKYERTNWKKNEPLQVGLKSLANIRHLISHSYMRLPTVSIARSLMLGAPLGYSLILDSLIASEYIDNIIDTKISTINWEYTSYGLGYIWSYKRDLDTLNAEYIRIKDLLISEELERKRKRNKNN